MNYSVGVNTRGSGAVTRATNRLARFMGVHILIVEDHPDTRVILLKLLVRCGHDVAAAETVKEALLLLDTFRFDVLVSDIGLPDGSGLELVVEAKRRQRLKQTVALTAFGTEDDRNRGLRAGYDYYLTKPLDFRRLQSVLAEV